MKKQAFPLDEAHVQYRALAGSFEFQCNLIVSMNFYDKK